MDFHNNDDDVDSDNDIHDDNNSEEGEKLEVSPCTHQALLVVVDVGFIN